jgi:hypothetical protein
MPSARAIFMKRLLRDVGLASSIVGTIVLSIGSGMTVHVIPYMIPYVIAIAIVLFGLIVWSLQTLKMTSQGASANTQLQPIPPAIISTVTAGKDSAA